MRSKVATATTTCSVTPSWSATVSSFATLPEVALLLASSRALAYHPPSKARMAAPLGEWLAGSRLRLD
jgi:hypothetical protein